VSAFATIAASLRTDRKMPVRVRIEIGDGSNGQEVQSITRILPSAVADILLKKISRGAEVEGESFRGFQSRV
jgi:hypothetical protein